MKPYQTDVEYLQDQLRRLELLIEHKLAARERKTGLEFTLHDLDHKSSGKEAGAIAGELRAWEAHIGERIGETRRAGNDLAAFRLIDEYALDPFEWDLLVLAMAPSLDLKFADLYDKLGYKFRGRTVDTALSILCGDLQEKVAARKYFALDANLIRNHLVLIERDRYRGEEDILNLDLKVPRRVMNLLLGSDALDESLVGFSKLVEPTVELEQVVLADAVKQKVLRLVSNHAEYLRKRYEWGFDRVITYGRGIILLFAGAPGTGKTMLANAVARHLAKRLLMVNADRLYDRVHTLESNVENVFREAKLQNSILFFDECEMLFADRRFGNNGVAELLTALERFDGIAILATNLAPALDEAMDRRIMLRVDFEVPTAELRRRIWANHIPPEAPVSPDLDLDALAQQFEFTGGYIKNAVLSTLHEVLARKEEKPEIRQDDLLAACRNQLRQKLGAYSDRIVPQVPLASVILPPPLRERVEEMIDSTRHHATVFQEWGLGTRLTSGRGLAALFQGPPGTGKSLTAEAVAFELGKNLYRISLPAVVSKFVGETEKNIKAVFQAARDGQSVLFFDEADALFSKRTQVTGALDKYANMETNLLLIELEQFEGLVVLATNLVGNLDPAFERRIAYRLTFPFPDATAREAIWRGLLPPQMPVAEPVDFAYLGRKFELSGGHIKNAVLRAAYRAARETGHRRVVTTQLLARAAEEEQQGTFVQKARIGFGG